MCQAAFQVSDRAQYIYDDLDRPSQVIDGEGNVAAYMYDTVGNLLFTTSVVIHAVLVLSRAILARFTFVRISCAVLVDTKGVGFALRWAM